MKNQILDLCPRMTVEPYAGAYGLCLEKQPQKNDSKSISCPYMAEGSYNQCKLYKRWKAHLTKILKEENNG